MTQPEHQHVFQRARLTYDDGTVIEGGRRCACGSEVVGDGLLAVNANLVRAGRSFNLAVAKGMTAIADEMAARRRRMFP